MSQEKTEAKTVRKPIPSRDQVECPNCGRTVDKTETGGIGFHGPDPNGIYFMCRGSENFVPITFE